MTIKSSELFVRELTHILIKNEAIEAHEEQPLVQGFKKSSYERYEVFLIEEGLVLADQMLQALSQFYKVPACDVLDYFFQHNLLHQFPKEFLLRNVIIPRELEDDMLIIVAADPSDAELLPKIGKIVSYDIRFEVGIYQDILDSIEEFYDRSITEKDEDGDDMEGSNFDDYSVDTSDVVIDSETEDT